MAELVSISDAARRLGIPRPTLSRIIKELKIDTSRQGKVKLVCLNTCQTHVQTLATQGRLLVRKRPKTNQQTDMDSNFFLKLYKEEIEKLLQERTKLQEKNEALQSELFEARGELKLLKGTTIKQQENVQKRSYSWLEKGKNIVKAISSELK